MECMTVRGDLKSEKARKGLCIPELPLLNVGIQTIVTFTRPATFLEQSGFNPINHRAKEELIVASNLIWRACGAFGCGKGKWGSNGIPSGAQEFSQLSEPTEESGMR
jgi:hypothetical protein